MSDRHPALIRLDVLVGRWTVQPKVEGLGPAWTEFSWQDDGAFLRQYTDAGPIPESAPAAWKENAPFPTTSLIGLDDSSEQFTMLYADARGVYRVYQMTFAAGTWSMWRSAPEFHQRFTGTVSPDESIVEGRWEISRDGTDWSVDFELTYTREM